MDTNNAIPVKPESEQLLYRCSFALPDFQLLNCQGDLLNGLLDAASSFGMSVPEDLWIDRKPEAPSSHSINMRLLKERGTFRLTPARYEVSANNYSEDELLKMMDGVGRIHRLLGERNPALLPTKSTVTLAFHLTLEGSTVENYFRNHLKGEGALGNKNFFGFEYDFNAPEANGNVLVEKSYSYKTALFVRTFFELKNEVTDFNSTRKEILRLLGERFIEVDLNVAEL